MMNNFIIFFCGCLFAFGLGMSGMTDPKKVIGFLDITGDWKPTLAFVMIGAIGVHSLLYFFIKKLHSPLLASNFSFPRSKDIDGALILGSIIFGVGWGIGGYCPGPALATLGGVIYSPFIFTGAMLIGVFLFHNIFSKEN
jgi:uncharacterized protein